MLDQEQLKLVNDHMKVAKIAACVLYRRFSWRYSFDEIKSDAEAELCELVSTDFTECPDVSKFLYTRIVSRLGKRYRRVKTDYGQLKEASVVDTYDCEADYIKQAVLTLSERDRAILATILGHPDGPTAGARQAGAQWGISHVAALNVKTKLRKKLERTILTAA